MLHCKQWVIHLEYGPADCVSKSVLSFASNHSDPSLIELTNLHFGLNAKDKRLWIIESLSSSLPQRYQLISERTTDGGIGRHLPNINKSKLVGAIRIIASLGCNSNASLKRNIWVASFAVWPVKSRQMSIKSDPKLISLEKWKIMTPLTNCLKMWQIGQNDCCYRLRKVVQSSINCPTWSRCFFDRIEPLMSLDCHSNFESEFSKVLTEAYTVQSSYMSISVRIWERDNGSIYVTT